jgi:hypothetical protein
MRVRATDTLASGEESAAPALVSFPLDDTYHVYCGEVKGGFCGNGSCCDGVCCDGVCCDGGVCGLVAWGSSASDASSFHGKKSDKSNRAQPDMPVKKTRTTQRPSGKKNNLLCILLNLFIVD